MINTIKIILLIVLVIMILLFIIFWDSRQNITGLKNSSLKNINTGSVDAVVTWVNSADPIWQQSKNFYKHNNKKVRFPIDDNADLEITFCIKCILKNLSWIDKIYIVLCCRNKDHFPKFLLENYEMENAYKNGKIKLIYHSDIFKLSECLPIFNSHAIEANLQNIPELSERFLYINDDCFVLRPVKEEDFFVNNRPVVRIERNLSRYQYLLENQMHGWHNIYTFFKDRKVIMPIHQVTPLTKSILRSGENMLTDHYNYTSCAKFRSINDVPPIGFSINLACLQGKMIELQNDNLVAFYDIDFITSNKYSLKLKFYVLSMYFGWANNLDIIIDTIQPDLLCMSQFWCNLDSNCLKQEINVLDAYLNQV